LLEASSGFVRPGARAPGDTDVFLGGLRGTEERLPEGGSLEPLTLPGRVMLRDSLDVSGEIGTAARALRFFVGQAGSGGRPFPQRLAESDDFKELAPAVEPL